MNPVWRKSSYSESGNCVEILWRKSTHSFSNGNCVEVASAPSLDTPEMVLVRDSKDPDGPRLSFDRREWAAFTATLQKIN